MDAGLDSNQDKRTGSFSVSELRARLDGKMQSNKDEVDQDESNKSSIRSLDSSFEIPKEEMSPIMKRINQFQAQNASNVGSRDFSTSSAHSRVSSTQAMQSTSSGAPEPSLPSSTDSAENLSRENLSLNSKKSPKSEPSNSPVASPSVAALRSQLALNPAMLRPGEPGRVKATRNQSGKSVDLSLSVSSNETSSPNVPVLEMPKTPSTTSGATPGSVRASSRVSDIQQRLALDPNMLLPSPQSGPPSRGHRRGKSSAAATPTGLSSEVSTDNQMNRPCIASKARRSRTSTKFLCDQESSDALEEIEKLTLELDTIANVSSTASPDENQISLPDQNQISLPEQNQVSVPDGNQISVPAGNQISVPDENQIAVPAENQISLSDENQISVPDENQISVPDENQISVPAENQISLPDENQICLDRSL